MLETIDWDAPNSPVTVSQGRSHGAYDGFVARRSSKPKNTGYGDLNLAGNLIVD
jgi:hypothetical protein